jgi:hypothetical protein
MAIEAIVYKNCKSYNGGRLLNSNIATLFHIIYFFRLDVSTANISMMWN